MSLGLAACLLAARPAGAQSEADVHAAREESPDGRAAREVPVVLVTEQALGRSAGTLGASAFGAATGDFPRQGSHEQPALGGGFRLFANPLAGLTLFGEGARRDDGRYAPSLGFGLRFVGDRIWALAALGRYKADGFAEVAGEAEGGLAFSYAESGGHFDLNLLAGGGFEEHEADGELLARGGYDIWPWLRVGGEGRARQRLAGSAKLAGRRDWDAFGGPQVVASVDHYFGALTAGPSNVGIARDVGWAVFASAGGVTF